MRFPGFIEDWEECEVGDYGKVITGSTPPTKDSANYEDGKYLWASPADLSDTKYISNTQTRLSALGFSKTRKLPKGSILATCIGSTIGKMGMASTEMSTNQQINAIVVGSNLDNHFVYYALQSRFPKYLMSVAIQAVPIISKSTFEHLVNYTTCIEEQHKIGSLLNLIDERISTQIGAINKHESLIKAIAGELTCKGEKVRLADLVDCHSSTMQENDITNDGPYPVYGATGICGYTDSPMCKEDAIIIVKDGSGVGNIKFVSGGFSILGTLCYITAKQDVSIGYVYCCLVNFDFSPYKTGMAIPHIYFKDYGKGKINIKNVAEQQKTRTLVLSLMNKLDVERQLLKQYKLQKQYLLSQMFV